MMGHKHPQSRLFYQLSLDELAPEHHIVRKLQKHIDLSFMRELCHEHYSHTGQPSVYPVVLFKWWNTLEDVVDFTEARACYMVQIKTPDLGGVQDIVESVLYCRAHGMEAYQGGMCNETEVSAQCCVHLAMAAHPERMLAKPGMGFDEGFTITWNKMERIRALMIAKGGAR